MGVWEEEATEKTKIELGNGPKIWLRIVNDVYGIWKEDGVCKTELYTKPTNRTRYLHMDSEHPNYGFGARVEIKGMLRCWKKLTSRMYGESRVKQKK